MLSFVLYNPSSKMVTYITHFLKTVTIIIYNKAGLEKFAGKMLIFPIKVLKIVHKTKKKTVFFKDENKVTDILLYIINIL